MDGHEYVTTAAYPRSWARSDVRAPAKAQVAASARPPRRSAAAGRRRARRHPQVNLLCLACHRFRRCTHEESGVFHASCRHRAWLRRCRFRHRLGASPGGPRRRAGRRGDPAWHRRGMAFTNAWYVGTAELESEGACFCASLKSIPSILARRMIAATTWSWPGVAAVLEPVLLVDARGRRRRGSEVLRGRVPLTIGIGSGFVDGEIVDVAIAIPRASADGHRQARGRIAALPMDRRFARRPWLDGRNRRRSAAPRPLHDGAPHRRHRACRPDRRWTGQRGHPAPEGGVLLGLAARGARIEPGDTLVEVDPGGVAFRCYGVGEGPRRIAASVVSAFAGPANARPATAFPTGAARRPVADAVIHTGLRRTSVSDAAIRFRSGSVTPL